MTAPATLAQRAERALAECDRLIAFWLPKRRYVTTQAGLRDAAAVIRDQREALAEAMSALSSLRAACEAARWPLTAEQMGPLNEARRLVRAWLAHQEGNGDG